MKKVIPAEKPDSFKEDWPGQFRIFSFLEFVTGIPQVLFAITTVKENGLPNVCLHSWSSFVSGRNAYYAVLAGIEKGTHTYRNILRTGEFCINFLGAEYMDALLSTISGNADDADEIAVGGFTRQDCDAVACPRIGESFMAMECRFERLADLSNEVEDAILIGRTVSVAVEEAFSHGIDEKYRDQGFMYNVHSPIDLSTGRSGKCAAAALSIRKLY